MYNIICPEQIGFSKDSRTSDHMFVLKTLIDKYTQQGSKHLYTCFVDFRKAFDTVWFGFRNIYVIILLNYFATLARSLTTTPNHQHKVDNEVSLSEGSQGYNYHQKC
jgi:hypothetical protein